MSDQGLFIYGVVVVLLCLAGWIFTILETIKIHKEKKS
jgi:hypothetical protein